MTSTRGMRLVESNDRYSRIRYLVDDRKKEDEGPRFQMAGTVEGEGKMITRGQVGRRQLDEGKKTRMDSKQARGGRNNTIKYPHSEGGHDLSGQVQSWVPDGNCLLID
jgi:hypothetical protein